MDITIDYIKERSSLDTTGCWLWKNYLTAYGYGSLKYKQKVWRAHRLAWTISNKIDIPEGMHICHTCDVRNCVNPCHLFLGTNQDNVNDRERKGRGVPHYGKQNNSSGIEDTVVIQIRKLENFVSAREIADVYHIHVSTVYRLWKRERRSRT